MDFSSGHQAGQYLQGLQNHGCLLCHYQHAHEEGGIEALILASRRKLNPKNLVDEAIEAAVIAYALEQPAHGQLRNSNKPRQRGVFVLH